MAFYDGTKLLSLKDCNGLQPEIYICTSNRNAGKTTYFGRRAVNRFKDSKKKFGLVYRFKNELDECSLKFFKDLKANFFSGDEMTAKLRAKDTFAELFLNGESCGYALPLNAADSIKKYSHLLSDVDHLIFDEFQSETNTYCPKEVQKFQSIHTSLARGQGKQIRYLPVIMLSNTITLLNPYYVSMGISAKLKSDTKFYKGDGFVLEQGYVDSVAKEQMASAFNRAFAGSAYVSYAAQGVYLNDNQSFITQMKGVSNYLCTIRYNGHSFGIREFPKDGVIYCNTKPDMSYPIRMSLTIQDHSSKFVLIKRSDMLVTQLRFYFDHGCFRFENLLAKEACMAMLSY